HRVRRRTVATVRVALLVLLALVAAWMPAVHAVPLRLRGGTVERAITVGRAVDTVLMDGVYVTNGVAVVFDVAAMLPGALHIELRNCVCDGGAQIYVRGYSGEPASDRSLEVSVSGLSGSYCSLVFVHNLPARTNVTVRDSTIVTPGPMRYSQLSGLTEAVASPLVLHATSLLQTQLRVSSTVLRSSQAGGTAVYVGGGVDLLSSAVVLDGVLLEASGGLTASAMNVTSSSRLSLRNHSVFSVKNVSVVSSGGGIVLGERLAVSNSVLRFVSVEGSVASPLVRCDTCGAQPRDEPVQRLLHGQLRCQFADARDVRSCVGPACQRRLRALHTEQLVECAEHRILQRRVCVWDVAVDGGSVLQFVSSEFRLG
ncbi:dispersed protein family protein 1, partial [Trypanosoma cruzi]